MGKVEGGGRKAEGGGRKKGESKQTAGFGDFRSEISDLRFQI
jgi:hypothetical protein